MTKNRKVTQSSRLGLFMLLFFLLNFLIQIVNIRNTVTGKSVYIQHHNSSIMIQQVNKYCNTQLSQQIGRFRDIALLFEDTPLYITPQRNPQTYSDLQKNNAIADISMIDKFYKVDSMYIENAYQKSANFMYINNCLKPQYFPYHKLPDKKTYEYECYSVVDSFYYYPIIGSEMKKNIKEYYNNIKQDVRHVGVGVEVLPNKLDKPLNDYILIGNVEVTDGDGNKEMATIAPLSKEDKIKIESFQPGDNKFLSYGIKKYKIISTYKQPTVIDLNIPEARLITKQIINKLLKHISKEKDINEIYRKIEEFQSQNNFNIKYKVHIINIIENVDNSRELNGISRKFYKFINSQQEISPIEETNDKLIIFGKLHPHNSLEYDPYSIINFANNFIREGISKKNIEKFKCKELNVNDVAVKSCHTEEKVEHENDIMYIDVSKNIIYTKKLSPVKNNNDDNNSKLHEQINEPYNQIINKHLGQRYHLKKITGQ